MEKHLSLSHEGIEMLRMGVCRMGREYHEDSIPYKLPHKHEWKNSVKGLKTHNKKCNESGDVALPQTTHRVIPHWMPSRKRHRESADEGSRKKLHIASGSDRRTMSPEDVRERAQRSTPTLPSPGVGAKVVASAESGGHHLLWFVANKKKTCPNCRDHITQIPAPSYVIKEMASIFVGRAELLPDGETMEEHAKWQQEEADIVKIDLANEHPRTGGLFKGSFKKGSRMIVNPIHDPGDNVDRCPYCHWELEEGMCLQCGIHIDRDTWESFSDTDSSGASTNGHGADEELDIDIDAEDADADFGLDIGLGAYPSDDDSEMHGSSPIGNAVRAEERRRRREARDEMVGFTVDGEWDTEEDEDEDSHSMQDFIDDDDEISPLYRIVSDSEEPADDAPRPSQQRRARRTIQTALDMEDDEISPLYRIVSDSEEPANDAPRPSQQRRARRTIQIDSDEDDEQSSDQAHAEQEDSSSASPEVMSSRRARPVQWSRLSGAIPISDDDDDEDESSDDSETERGDEIGSHEGGFSPLQHSDDDDDDEDHDEHDSEHYGEHEHEYGDYGDSDASDIGWGPRSFPNH
ncbi:E3 ubiquitin ligase [Zalaria obscura]|uniref:E3 ubiquitin ligase n=1 Tax=Zalaria obscura TaxID=2024903 RepID=A0ACC3SK16_9PEZI